MSCEEGAFIKRPPCHHLWPPILLRDLKTTITFFSVEPAELSQFYLIATITEINHAHHIRAILFYNTI